MCKILFIIKGNLEGVCLPIRFVSYELAMKYVIELEKLNASFGITCLDYKIEKEA